MYCVRFKTNVVSTFGTAVNDMANVQSHETIKIGKIIHRVMYSIE